MVGAAVGAFTLGVLAVAGDVSPAAKKLMIFYRPTGPLSGMTTVTIVVWLGAWAMLHAMWRRRDISMRAVSFVSFTLLALSLLLTFPPVGDMF